MADSLRDRLATVQCQRDCFAAEVEQLGALVVDLRRQVDSLQATVDEDTVYLARADNWLAQATAAEDDLTALRRDVRELVASLRDVTHGGPVAYRGTIADRLATILRGA